MKRALILGISGQDGAYLADLLLKKGFHVHGTTRDRDGMPLGNLSALGILKQVDLHTVLPFDFRNTLSVIKAVKPDRIFNLAGQSSASRSFEQPGETIERLVQGVVNVLEAVRILELDSRIFNAGSSECFGNTLAGPADESTPFSPRSPYGVGKVACHFSVAHYRDVFGVYACTGLLFNHESPLRSVRYVTQKIVHGVLDIVEGKASVLELGRLDTSRDWGWAPDYVDAMQRMLEMPEPQDFVIATGETNSLQDFVEACFSRYGLDWTSYVRSRDEFRRPTDIVHSSANPAKAERMLGWKATVTMRRVIDLLFEAEMVKRGLRQ